MPLIKPAALQPGDTVAVIAPASRPVLPSSLAQGIHQLENMGFQVKCGSHVLSRNGFLAGTDEDRLQDLHDMFADPEVKGIFCARGGYGCGRLLPLVDFGLIRANPKVFIGYSDITALQIALLNETGLVTFWGPMVSSELGKHPFPEYNRRALLKAITHGDPIGIIDDAPDAPPLQIVNSGHAQGPLVGGTLSLLAASMGTPWELNSDGAILFLEEVGEEPHKIDRMLNQLLQAGKLDGIAGAVIGECHGCGSATHGPAFPYGNFSVEEVFCDYFGKLDIPVISGMAIGHGTFKTTMPIGVSATLDANQGTLSIDETGVI